MVFWAPGRAAHSCTAFRVGNETSVTRANGDAPVGDPRIRYDLRPVAPTSAAFPIGRCSRSYRRSNCSESVGVGYSTRSLTLMALSSSDVRLTARLDRSRPAARLQTIRQGRYPADSMQLRTLCLARCSMTETWVGGSPSIVATYY